MKTMWCGVSCDAAVTATRALLVLAALAGGAGGEVGRDAGGDVGGSTEESPLDVGSLDVGPWRDLWYGSLEALHREPVINNTQEDVLAQLGAVAYLHCPVRHLGERGVSWVRRRDWHIISSGVLMYTNDERFQVLHSEGSDDWILQIKYVQKRDNGTYECQVSTGGGTLSRLVHLHIAVPEAFILGADEHHVDAGSTINLVCIIEKSPVPPQYVFWYHNARMINYDAAQGVSVATAPGPKTQSALAIARAAPHHSGNYSCRAPNTEPAHILVYVSEGSDKMAATLSRNGVRRLAMPSVALLLLALLWAVVLRGQQTSVGSRGQQTSGMSRGQQTSVGSRGQHTSSELRGQQTSGVLRGQQTSGVLRGQQTAVGSRGQQRSGVLRGQQTSVFASAASASLRPPCDIRTEVEVSSCIEY